MKKIISLLLTLILLFVTTIPTLAVEKDTTQANKVSAYNKLDNAFSKVVSEKNVLKSIRFDSASPQVKEYLEKIDISPESVGRISYVLDKNILNIHILIQIDDTHYKTLTAASYIENNNDLVRVSNTDLIEEFSLSSTVSRYYSSSSGNTSIGELNVYAVLYYEVEQSVDYIRPYQGSFFYMFNGSSYTVTNWTGQYVVNGYLCNNNLEDVQEDDTWPYQWYVNQAVIYPVEAQAYNAYNQFSSSYCLKIYGYNCSQYYTFSFKKPVGSSYTTYSDSISF